MDKNGMRSMLASYKRLMGDVETRMGNIRRIGSCSFEAYIAGRMLRSSMGESRLRERGRGGSTEALGIGGRKEFERERDWQLGQEVLRMEEHRALLERLDRVIGCLDDEEKELIIRRYVQGESVDKVYESMGLSRATAFRRIESAIEKLAGMYNEWYCQAA